MRHRQSFNEENGADGGATFRSVSMKSVKPSEEDEAATVILIAFNVATRARAGRDDNSFRLDNGL